MGRHWFASDAPLVTWVVAYGKGVPHLRAVTHAGPQV